jgi:hypothetical protein
MAIPSEGLCRELANFQSIGVRYFHQSATLRTSSHRFDMAQPQSTFINNIACENSEWILGITDGMDWKLGIMESVRGL